MTATDAYQYFVLHAQEIALSKNWTPVNWYDRYATLVCIFIIPSQGFLVSKVENLGGLFVKFKNPWVFSSPDLKFREP